jgi:hypothetical protein
MKATRFIGMLLGGMMMVHVLSVGPAVRWTEVAPTYDSHTNRLRIVLEVYSPIAWLMRFKPVGNALRLYIDFWMPRPEETPYRRAPIVPQPSRPN